MIVGRCVFDSFNQLRMTPITVVVLVSVPDNQVDKTLLVFFQIIH